MEKEIYVLKWIPSGALGSAFTDKERAEKVAARSNKQRKWYHHMAGGQWIVSTLKLIEGRGKKYGERT